MRASSILSFAIFGLAIASPLKDEKRQLATIQSALKTVTDSLTKLTTAVGQFNGDAAGAAPLLDASNGVQKAITGATTMVNSAQTLSLQDALSLQQSTNPLVTSVNQVVDTLTQKKPQFDQAGVSSVVAQSLAQQKQASSGLATAITSKVPAIGKNIAMQQAGQITAALDKGLQAFGGAQAAAGAGAGTGNSTTNSTAPKF